MQRAKDYLKAILYILGFLIVLNIITTILNYFDILNYSTIKWLKAFTMIVSMLAGGFIIGKNSSNKGYMQGLKLGIIFVIILFIFSFLGLDKSFGVKRLIYYLIITLSSMLGSMFGITKSIRAKDMAK